MSIADSPAYPQAIDEAGYLTTLNSGLTIRQAYKLQAIQGMMAGCPWTADTLLPTEMATVKAMINLCAGIADEAIAEDEAHYAAVHESNKVSPDYGKEPPEKENAGE